MGKAQGSVTAGLLRNAGQEPAGGEKARSLSAPPAPPWEQSPRGSGQPSPVPPGCGRRSPAPGPAAEAEIWGRIPAFHCGSKKKTNPFLHGAQQQRSPPCAQPMPGAGGSVLSAQGGSELRDAGSGERGSAAVGAFLAPPRLAPVPSGPRGSPARCGGRTRPGPAPLCSAPARHGTARHGKARPAAQRPGELPARHRLARLGTGRLSTDRAAEPGSGTGQPRGRRAGTAGVGLGTTGARRGGWRGACPGSPRGWQGSPAPPW